MNDAVLIEVTNDIATLTLNRPEAGNAINLAIAEGLLAAAIRCEEDSTIRCVVLTGAGKLFCGGGDVGGFAAVGDEVPSHLHRLAGALHAGISRLMRMPKPLLVLANGPAAGAGLSLALAGDVVIAVDTAHFTCAYGSVGLTPDGGMSWHLPRLIGMRRAQEMVITNRRVTAVEAESIGLITRAVPAEALAREGEQQAALLAAAPTAAVGAARQLLLSAFEGSLEAQLEREVRSITTAAGSAECREGVSAFLERRKPDFKGVS